MAKTVREQECTRSIEQRPGGTQQGPGADEHLVASRFHGRPAHRDESPGELQLEGDEFAAVAVGLGQAAEAVVLSGDRMPSSD